MNDKFRMEIDDNIEFAKRQIVDSIYREARVEGINVTFPETQAIYDGAVVDSLTYEDVTKIVNLKKAWYFIFDSIEYPLDLRYLRHINSIVQSNIMRTAGTIREISVRISGTDWIPEIPTNDGIERELERIRGFACPTERSLELMLSVMRGQYFDDGNKRTAQLVANHELICNGCGIVSIPEKHREEFSNLLVDFYVTDKREKIKDFLYSECLSGYNRAKSFSEEKAESQKKEDEEAIRSFLSSHTQNVDNSPS